MVVVDVKILVKRTNPGAYNATNGIGTPAVSSGGISTRVQLLSLHLNIDNNQILTQKILSLMRESIDNLQSLTQSRLTANRQQHKFDFLS